MAEELPSLHIDTDWKKQAQEEKRKLAEAQEKQRAEAAAKAAVPAVAAASARCRYHPRNPARLFCPKCHGSYCELCVNVRAVDGESKSFCRACAVECLPVEPSEE